MKPGLMSITLLFVWPMSALAQTADEIVKKVLDARGGVEKIKAVQSERVSGHVSFARGMEGTFVVELKRPLKMRAEISIEGQKLIRDYDGPLVDYKSKGNQIEFAGKEVLDDKPVYRLKLTNKNGDVRSYFFDASSFLLLKWDGVRKTGDQEVPWESFFSDYHEVQALQYPFRIDQGSP